MKGNYKKYLYDQINLFFENHYKDFVYMISEQVDATIDKIIKEKIDKLIEDTTRHMVTNRVEKYIVNNLHEEIERQYLKYNAEINREMETLMKLEIKKIFKKKKDKLK